MGLRLGNLTLQQVELKHKFSISDEDMTLLKNKRQDDAQNIKNGMFHIFDLPQTSFHFSSEDDARKTVEILQKYGSEIKGQINFTWEAK